MQIGANHNNSNKLAVFIVLHHVTSGMPDLRLHQAQRSVHRAGQQPAVQYATMKTEPTQSLKYIHPTTAPLCQCIAIASFCSTSTAWTCHSSRSIRTLKHIKIVFRKASAVFYFLRKSAKRQTQVNVFGRTLCTNQVFSCKNIAVIKT